MILFLLACSDYGVIKTEPKEPTLLVHPQHIDFGHLISGQEKSSENIYIINSGDSDLEIFSPELISGNDRFSIDASNVPLIIEVDEVVELQVNYEPETYESNGAFIRIISSDEETTTVEVTLEGYGDAPVLSIDPLEIDWGDITIGCDIEERITVENAGNMDLIIDDLDQLVNSPIDIILENGSLPSTPWEIQPNHQLDFLVSYIPTDLGNDESIIKIVSNDPQNPELEVIQKGFGEVEQWHEQTYIQDEMPILDILWVIDNSGSMNRFQTNLSNNTSSFVNAFISAGADFHIAVITTDNPSFLTIVDNNTPNLTSTLANLLVPGVYGSGNEKGLEMSYNSLSDSNYAGPGGQFFRNDSKLIVIYVSDEQDWSHPGWQSYVNFFDNLKTSGDFIPYGVIGDVPGGCNLGPGTWTGAQPGYGYHDLINHYGGKWYSICAQDWGLQLKDLADEVTASRYIVLEEEDVLEETIEITVNGQLVEDWLYEQSDNRIAFDIDKEPEPGQTVVVKYAVRGCGDD